MGEIFIKKEGGKEVAYEKGILWDRKIGELHEKLDGTKETSKIFRNNVKVERKSVISNERNAQVGNVKGVFREDLVDSYPTFKPEKDESTRKKEGSSSIESAKQSIGSNSSKVTSTKSIMEKTKPHDWEIPEWVSEYIGPIVFPLVSCVTLYGSIWGMKHVTEYSLVWWLCLLCGLASIPGVIIGLLYILGIMLIILVLSGIVELIKYFIKNPW